MPLILFHTRRVREALKAPAALGIDAIFLLGAFSVIGILVMVTRQWSAPFSEKVVISQSFWALPKYTLLSLSRGFAAYGVSLVFTLIYGTIAAHNQRAERVMIPALDVLQAIPVLGFLPGLVMALVTIFPNREIGLEIACVLMIFTGQAWNMTFSFHGSLRGIPTPLREAARMNRLSGWQVFRLLEVPASMIGLVWNSMMSMAGGWFFLTVNEAFTLGDHDYRLPGIGSYMNEAINAGNTPAMLGAIVAMVLMIIATDQLVWRPIVVWSQRFKLEDSTDNDKPQSWVLNLLQQSRLYHFILSRLIGFTKHQSVRIKRIEAESRSPVLLAMRTGMLSVLKPLSIGSVILVVGWGCYLLASLLLEATRQGEWTQVVLALGASFLRTSAAVVLGAAWALPVGIMIGRSPKWSQRLQPIIQVVASFPAPMLFPLVTLALAWLHVPFTFGCVALMLLGAQWYILFNVIAGATAIPADLKEVGEVYHMSSWQKWRRLYLPCVFPFLITGLVTAAGGAWNATIVSEFVQIKGQTYIAFGLGSTISQATAKGNFPLLTASVVTMALAVVLLNRLIWKRLYRLAENRFSLNT